MAAVREALDEVVRSARSTPEPASPSELFAAGVTALQARRQQHTPELLAILASELPSVPSELVRRKYTPVMQVLRAIHAANRDADGAAEVLPGVLECVGHVLSHLDASAATWGRPETLQAFNLLVGHMHDEASAVRARAHGAAVAILSCHARQRSHALARHVAEYCAGVLSACPVAPAAPSAATSAALHILAFLGAAFPTLALDEPAQLYGALLRLVLNGAPRLAQMSTRALGALVASASVHLTADDLTSLVTQLAQANRARAPGADWRPTVLRSRLVILALERLRRLDARAWAAHAMPALSPLVRVCECAEEEAWRAACSELERAYAWLGDTAVVTAPLAKHVAATLHELLHHRFQHAWPAVLALISTCFACVTAEHAPSLCAPILQSLGELRDALESAPTAAASSLGALVATTVGAAVRALSPELFLHALPLVVVDPPRFRAWLVPVLRAHLKAARHCELRFFHEHIMVLAHAMSEQARTALARGDAVQAQRSHQHYVQLWSLLPSFCEAANDVPTAFPTLAPVLEQIVREQSSAELVPAVCSALQTLVRCAHAQSSRDAIASFAPKLLRALLRVLDRDVTAGAANSHRVVSEAIAALAPATPPNVRATLFKQLMQKMLTVSQPAPPSPDAAAPDTHAQAVVLCELALALLPSLDIASVTLLYRVVQPMVKMDESAALQKRAYKILCSICETHATFVQEPARLSELLGLLAASLVTCHTSSRQMRLRCLAAISSNLPPAHAERTRVVGSVIGEVTVCLKDANRKTRDAAALLLFSMARAHAGGVPAFVQQVVGALAAKTTHMRSAAVLALARLVHQFRAEGVEPLITDLISTVLLLIDDPSRELAKAIVIFIHAAIRAVPPGTLRPHAGDIVGALLTASVKGRFRARIK